MDTKRDIIKEPINQANRLGTEKYFHVVFGDEHAEEIIRCKGVPMS